jgi:hypothetical protein|tara:strand:- start:599 stop:826 length:228 start_codon:yes stop_codon:yes gene_type:complete
MDGNYFVIGIITFLFVLSIKKYTDIESLQECIENYLAEISPLEVIEEEDVVELEEVRDLITDFVISNREIFSKCK